MLGATFEPVTHQSSAAPVTSLKTVPPHLVVSSIPYPVHELEVGGEGIVDVEFTLDGSGQLQGFSQIYTDRKGLGVEIPNFLHAALFWLPADWDSSQKVSMEFRYGWVGTITESCPAKPPHAAVDAEMNICCARADKDINGPFVAQKFQCHSDVRFK